MLRRYRRLKTAIISINGSATAKKFQCEIRVYRKLKPHLKTTFLKTAKCYAYPGDNGYLTRSRIGVFLPVKPVKILTKIGFVPTLGD